MPNPPAYRYLLQLLVDAPIQRFYLEPGRYLIGSDDGAELRIPVAGISRRHAELEILPDGGALLTDLESTNGCYLNRSRIRRAALSGNALLGFGPVEADLRTLEQDLAAIALATGSAQPATAADDQPAESGLTRVIDLETRLLDPLGQLGNELLAGRMDGANFARSLLTAWQHNLAATAITLERDDLIVAAVGGPLTADPATFEISRDAQRLRIWAAAELDLERSRPVLRIALQMIDGIQPGSARPTATFAVSPPAQAPSPGTATLYRTAARVAASEIPALILGESGVGKEVLARWIHQASPRAAGPFLAINCAALPRDLLEAELFGVERGAATGVNPRPGLFARADGGTLLLDEIGDMALETQAKLLRVLETKSYFRLGGQQPERVDVRILSATNRNLSDEMEHQRFRPDLFFRIAAFELLIPPLRERPEDILHFASEFFRDYTRQRGINSPGITKGALGTLLAHPWPGNVRELRNELERAVLLLEPNEPLDLIHLSPRIQGLANSGVTADLRLDNAVRRAELTAFRIALAAAGSDQGQAMQLLGLPRSTYYRKLRELGFADDAND